MKRTHCADYIFPGFLQASTFSNITASNYSPLRAEDADNGFREYILTAQSCTPGLAIIQIIPHESWSKDVLLHDIDLDLLTAGSREGVDTESMQSMFEEQFVAPTLEDAIVPSPYWEGCIFLQGLGG